MGKMSSNGENRRKSFTFLWELENASYCWHTREECITSPSFTVDEINETNWRLELFLSIERNNIGLYLKRLTDNKSLESVKVDCDISFLSSDGAVLLEALHRKNVAIRKEGCVGCPSAALRNGIFVTRRSIFLPQDTLTIRCRMWNSIGEMSKDVQYLSRTRIDIEKRSFVWKIEKFSTLKRMEKKSYEIKSHGSGKHFMSVELLSTGGMVSDETIRFKIVPNYQSIKVSTFQLSIVDASKNIVKCFQDEFWCSDGCESKDFTLFCTKTELMGKKHVYLPNDVLSLFCECVFSFGSVKEEISKIDIDSIAIAKKVPDTPSVVNQTLDNKNPCPDPCCILINNLKSMLNNNSLSDVKLKTKNQTYPAHTFILGARSPVFKAMFSNEMKEKINERVDIEDLSDDTVLRMLHYIYAAEVQELDWSSATELYIAADKYQILNLKDICSVYLKNNLCVNNACEALILADFHQDEDLKSVVQNFILRHGKDIIYSVEWDQLMETNVNLAAQTMRLKFKG